MKIALVTGANGFVGRAVTQRLVEDNYYVYALVRKASIVDKSLLNSKSIKIVYCDMSEYSNLENIIDLNKEEIDVFFHFAWEGSAGKKREDEIIQLHNIKYSCDAVRSAKRLHIKKFIFASSIMEYEIGKLMRTEKMPGKETVYCTAKMAANYMSRTIAASVGIEYISAVISNIYGPGEYSSRLINSSIAKMLNGEHISFTAGEQLYDFIYITDAANIFVRIAEMGRANETYYVGNSQQRKLKDFLLKLGGIIDPTAVIGLGELEYNGVSLDYTELDTEKVQKQLNYYPEITFEEGIKITKEWIEKKGW